MEYGEEDFLMLSGIQHFSFCRRQWALIHIEQQWQENERTAEGELLHQRAHDPYLSEKRKDVLISRGLPVFSRTLGINGVCDVVEFHRADDGTLLHGHRGLFQIYPVEYKRGTPKESEADILQLTAQAMCLEEMMMTEIAEGALYYAQTRRRQSVELTELLRSQQYRLAGEEEKSLSVARNCILGKVYNARWVLERALRDHAMQLNAERVRGASGFLQKALRSIETCTSMDALRGLEGEAASVYFSVFDELILQQKKAFSFHGRNCRPPLDNVNALLSFVYTLLTSMMTSALETVGLDPYVGFMHADRPGRVSLSLDLIEELRPVLADRFVLTLINRKMVSAKDFTQKEDGAVLLGDEARKRLLVEWQQRKKDVITLRIWTN